MSNRLPEKTPIRVGMISLGCAKNLVDAEIMLGALLKDGVEITNNPTEADVVIVNTCSFIDSAQEESVETILESAEVRKASHRGQALVVSGCLPQRFKADLPKLLPEVDAFMGIDQVTQAGEIVRKALNLRADKLANPQPRRARNTSAANIVGKMELSAPAEAGTSLRGTDKFGKTKVVVAPPSTAGPLIDVNLRPKFIPDYETPRFRLTPKHFAYLKIAEGCNHPCSFCIIPQMRGSHRSRQPSDIISEACGLIADGVKEINLISQDSTYYGLDLRPQASRAIASPERFRAAVQSLHGSSPTLSSLLRDLDQVTGDFWVRLLYTHPAHWTDELIETIARSKKVARYIDIPLQHIHENMLERMRRETSRQYIIELLARLRAGIPGVSLRTTFIVGFPGETESYFESLLDFMRETRFERLGIFMYSQEEGTRAGRMAGQIPAKIRHERRDRAMALQREIAASISRASIGRIVRVLIEKPAGAGEVKAARIHSWEHRPPVRDLAVKKARGIFVARGEADAPDIDGRVYVHGPVTPGQFANVKITGCGDYDLFAQSVSKITTQDQPSRARI